VRCCDVRFLVAFLFFLFTPLLLANTFSILRYLLGLLGEARRVAKQNAALEKSLEGVDAPR
jgi:hypothetical protein